MSRVPAEEAPYAALIEAERQAALDAGRPEEVARQHSLGKLTARERVYLLVDEGTFREFGALVAPTRDTTFRGELKAPGDGVVTGTAEIDGRPVTLASFDFMAAGGSNGSAGGLKMERLAEMALRQGVPLVMVLDGGGHRLQEGLDSWHFAWGFPLFDQMVDLSGWVPIIAVMVGPNFGGPTNFAALADYVVMVRDISNLGIAGPPLVRAANGEDITKEALGGADLQCGRGVADLAVDTETEAFDSVRAFLSFLPTNSASPPLHTSDPTAHPSAPGVGRLVPADTRSGYDVRPVVDAIADEHSVFELRPTFAPNVVTALSRLGGRPVGVIANQPLHLGGAIDSPAAEKVAHFVSMCDAFGLALVYLIDVPGFLGGSVAEETQLGRRSGRMLFELGQATVPRFSVVLRKGYGGGYIAMNGGRSFRADLALAWPSAEISATAIDAALDIAYRRQVAAADDPAAERERLAREFAVDINPLAAARGFGVDDIVDPDQTRDRLIEALRIEPLRHESRTPRKPHAISPI